MSTLIKPHLPSGSEPSRDDDLTGVRALLSALPEPEPMPDHLVARINASLIAEQAQRTARMSGAPVTPLLSTGHRRRARLLLAMAGAAAAVTLVTAIGVEMFTAGQLTPTSGSAAVARASAHARTGESDGAAPPLAGKKASPLTDSATTPSSIQIGRSGTRYTQASFAAQAKTLRGAPLHPVQPPTAASLPAGPAGTPRGLSECLRAIGASGAQLVRADVAFYQGRPAVVIVATTNGIPVAYAVGRQCSHLDAVVLHPGTPLS